MTIGRVRCNSWAWTRCHPTARRREVGAAMRGRSSSVGALHLIEAVNRWNGCEWLEMALHGWKRLETAGTAGSGWKWLEWLEMAGNSWK